MKKVKCPDCDGKGYQEYVSETLFTIVLEDNQNSKVTITQCDICKGTGKIDDPTEDVSQSNLPEFRW